jgi:hypothetical protein
MVQKALTDLVKRVGSQRAAAAFLGISSPHMSELLRETRRPGERVLKRLGLKKTVVYEPVKGKHSDEESL